MSLHEPNAYSTKFHGNLTPLQSSTRSKSPASLSFFENEGQSLNGLSIDKQRLDLQGAAQVQDIKVRRSVAKPETMEQPTSPLTSLVRRHVRQQTPVAKVHSVLEQPPSFSSRPSTGQRSCSLPSGASRRPSLQRALSIEEVDDRSQKAVDWFQKIHDANAKARPIEDITAKLANARLKRHVSLEETGSNSDGSTSTASTSGFSQQKAVAMARLSASAKNWESFGISLGGAPKTEPQKPPPAPQPKQMPSFLRDPFFRPSTPTQTKRRHTVE